MHLMHPFNEMAHAAMKICMHLIMKSCMLPSGGAGVADQALIARKPSGPATFRVCPACRAAHRCSASLERGNYHASNSGSFALGRGQFRKFNAKRAILQLKW